MVLVKGLIIVIYSILNSLSIGIYIISIGCYVQYVLIDFFLVRCEIIVDVVTTFKIFNIT